MTLALSHRDGRVLHGGDDLVVTGAPAEVAGEPVADLRVGRIWIPLEKRLAGHDETRRADAALERGVLEELLLQGVEGLPLRHALDRLDPVSPDLAAQHQAGTDQPAVQHDAARAAVAGCAAFLAAGQVERVAQDVEERLFRVAEELDRVSVHRRFDVVLGHQWVLARSRAIRATRRASTDATSVRNSV